MSTHLQNAGLVLALTLVVCAQSGAQAPQSGTQAPQSARSAAPAAKSSSGWTKKTPWGDPDIQGIWNNGTTTPLERPPALADKTELTPEEFAARKKEDDRRQAEGETPEQLKQGLGAGPTFWYEIGKTTNRTSMITDPPNGRLPALTPQAQKLLEERKQQLSEIPLDKFLWEHQGQWVRCTSRGVPGGTIPTVYNNNYQILQVPGYVVISMEMVHETRIIPLDNRPVSPVRRWLGEARGRWEGQTLVVETTNFHPQTQFNRGPNLMGPDGKVTERFTRTSATDLDYTFTVDAPSTFTRPFSASIPMSTVDAPDRIMEYACLEGDQSVRLTITGLLKQKAGK